MLALLAREGLLAEIEAYTHPIRGFPDDVRLRDGVGRTPLHRAVHAGTVDMDAIVMQLASALASPAAGDVADGAGGVSQGGGEGEVDDPPRALGRASAAVVERVRVVELLLQRQAAPDATDACGRTALMEAARSGNVALVRVLLGQTVEQAGVAAASDVHAPGDAVRRRRAPRAHRRVGLRPPHATGRRSYGPGGTIARDMGVGGPEDARHDAHDDARGARPPPRRDQALRSQPRA